MEDRSRREWKLTLQTLRLIGVSWYDLISVSVADAWRWLGWDAARHREWQSALEVAGGHLEGSSERGINVVTEMDEDTPSWLRNLPTVPWVFYRGDLAILDRTTLGFSGQREAGEQSLAITAALGREAAQLSYTVVSGGARGTDMAAHSSVLDAGGSTAVILPEGLLQWRPPHVFTDSQVLAVSEDVPWEPWNTESAMRRNRMIVNLSRIFTVPQSGTTGGSHSTGMYALRQGRVTYVPDLGASYPGNQKLLQHGARPLTLSNGRYDLEQMLAESTPEPGHSQAPLF